MVAVPLEEPRPKVARPLRPRMPSASDARPPWRPSRRVFVLAVLTALVAAAAGFGWKIAFRPMTVAVAPISTDVPVRVFGLGTVGARVQSNIGFKVSGVLVTLDADSGDRVRVGSVLARLDAREVAAQLGQANAGILQARANLVKARADVDAAEANRTNAAAMARRRGDLAQSGHASVEEAQTSRTAELTALAAVGIARAGVDVAEAAVTAADAQVTYARAVLDNYTLRAPYDAVVVARNLELGSMPVPGQAIFTLVDPATIWVLGYVDERLAGELAVGQPAEIILRSQPGQRHPAHVARIEIQSNAVNEERLVELSFDNTPQDVHLAEQAEVVITTGGLDHAVLVPPTAVTGHNGGHGLVWTIEDGTLARRDVAFGAPLLNGQLPIVEPLPEGVRVVVSPITGLRAGRVAVIATAVAK